MYAALRAPSNTSNPCNAMCPILPLALCPICWPFAPVMFCWMRNSHVSAANSFYIITAEEIHIQVASHQAPRCSCCISDKSENRKIPMERYETFTVPIWSHCFGWIHIFGYFFCGFWAFVFCSLLPHTTEGYFFQMCTSIEFH